MLLQVVAVRDAAVDAFGRPIVVPSVGQAIRSFMDEVNRASEDNPMHGHPEDFVLYKLATFEDSTGRFEALPQPEKLLAADQVGKGKLSASASDVVAVNGGQ